MVEVNFQRENVDHLLKMFDYERGEKIQLIFAVNMGVEE